jgi:hypothetical protein
VSGTCEKIGFTDFSTTYFQCFALWITGPNSIFSHVPGTISLGEPRSEPPAPSPFAFPPPRPISGNVQRDPQRLREARELGGREGAHKIGELRLTYASNQKPSRISFAQSCFNCPASLCRAPHLAGHSCSGRRCGHVRPGSRGRPPKRGSADFVPFKVCGS